MADRYICAGCEKPIEDIKKGIYDKVHELYFHNCCEDMPKKGPFGPRCIDVWAYDEARRSGSFVMTDLKPINGIEKVVTQ